MHFKFLPSLRYRDDTQNEIKNKNRSAALTTRAG